MHLYTHCVLTLELDPLSETLAALFLARFSFSSSRIGTKAARSRENAQLLWSCFREFFFITKQVCANLKVPAAEKLYTALLEKLHWEATVLTQSCPCVRNISAVSIWGQGTSRPLLAFLLFRARTATETNGSFRGWFRMDRTDRNQTPKHFLFSPQNHPDNSQNCKINWLPSPWSMKSALWKQVHPCGIIPLSPPDTAAALRLIRNLVIQTFLLGVTFSNKAGGTCKQFELSGDKRKTFASRLGLVRLFLGEQFPRCKLRWWDLLFASLSPSERTDPERQCRLPHCADKDWVKRSGNGLHPPA